MISGRGVYFANRKQFFDSFWNTTNIEFTLDLLGKYNGNNTDEIFREAFNEGHFLSAHPNPKIYSYGIISEEEIKKVKNVLGDDEIKKKLLDCRLIDVEDGGRMLIRDANDNNAPVEIVIIPKGTFMINCTTTSIYHTSNEKKPYLSYDNLVLTPQIAYNVMSQREAHFLTHFWYLGTFTNNNMIKYINNVDPKEKNKYVLSSYIHAYLNIKDIGYPVTFPKDQKMDHAVKKVPFFRRLKLLITKFMMNFLEDKQQLFSS